MQLRSEQDAGGTRDRAQSRIGSFVIVPLAVAEIAYVSSGGLRRGEPARFDFERTALQDGSDERPIGTRSHGDAGAGPRRQRRDDSQRERVCVSQPPLIVIEHRSVARITSGFGCNFDDHTYRLTLKNEFKTSGRHMPSLDHPFFALLDENHGHDAPGRLLDIERYKERTKKYGEAAAPYAAIVSHYADVTIYDTTYRKFARQERYEHSVGYQLYQGMNGKACY